MSDPFYNAIPQGGYALDGDEWVCDICGELNRGRDECLFCRATGQHLSHRRSIMNVKDFWNRLSAKTRRRLIIAAAYIVWIVAFWLLGPTAKIGKATAFFGLAALTGVFAGIVLVVEKILGLEGE